MNPSSDKLFNVASLLVNMAKERPYKRAVVCPSGRDDQGRLTFTHLTFRQLDMESDCLAHGLDSIGLSKGVKTLLMVRPGIDFFTLVFALFKTGAIPIVIDPGMGKEGMLQCIRKCAPEAFIGVPEAHVARVLNRSAFRSVRVNVTAGPRWFWGGYTLRELFYLPWSSYPVATTQRSDKAAILFTSGSTGPAKGAVYTHGNFDAQIRTIRSHFHIAPDEIDLATFPLFALFDPALGMTAVIPEMDFTKPAEADPQGIIEVILSQGVTNMFASPALLRRIGEYGAQNKIGLHSLKRVVSAGAPVPADTIETFSRMLADGVEIHTPYGATEAVPVTSIGSREILGETVSLTRNGYGICVGRPLAGVRMNVIKITDQPIAKWHEQLVMDRAEVGEIVVSGDLVSRQYFEDPEMSALHKIQDGQTLWHRMGDLGWFDSQGRLWFCGRKSHRVQTRKGELYTIPCEAIFNQHPNVFRSALVGVGQPPDQTPAICIEPVMGDSPIDLKQLEQELLETASRHPLVQDIRHVLFPGAFPVDVRHNAKINREALALWAEKKLRGKIDNAEAS
ncbi:fatty acid CoA ligase family protein [Desulfatirhabdium butyrativorans]|uniref:fatty acid CoA ligase family protein n=1 Tax=Desulfatirhabdium butyrativorans TaxID=340467 RepID=UPI0004191151|nr:fatty acid CoA ligase family protein [Desulfatirhabdium butyrativorans]